MKPRPPITTPPRTYPSEPTPSCDVAAATDSRSVGFLHRDVSTRELQKNDRYKRNPSMQVVIFWPKKYKTEYRTSTNRTASVDRCDMHLVIFLAKEIQTRRGAHA